MGSRPGSPDNVMSDSEFETGKRGSISGSGGSGGKKEAEQSWEWGQLPSSITPTHGKNSNKNSEKNKQDGDSDGIDPAGKNIEPAPGWFGGLFGSKKNREDDHQPGIYFFQTYNEIVSIFSEWTLDMGPFIYYVSTCRGGGQKMPIFAYS